MAVVKSYRGANWSAGGVGPSNFFFMCPTEAELPTTGVLAGDEAFTTDTARAWIATAANTWSPPSGLMRSITGTAATSGTGETLLANCRLPANAVVAGTSFRVRCVGISSSTGTLIFRVRVGALGTVAGDAQAWISTTSAAQAANARAGLDVIVTVRSIGSGGTVYADGAAHAGAILLPTLIGAPATTAAATSAAWFIDVSATCSVGTFTAQILTVEAM